ncbi:hypothetical protein [Paracoccus sp. M683]|uniref:hypothetical protein n=1 Tax=Paracoccus sp. M683 TaxID=2594268 RepID=UPI002102C051|nr:hypothetical protein [Paracoccus sp. M683]
MAVLTHACPAGTGDDAVKGTHPVMSLDLNGGMGADQRIEIKIVTCCQSLNAILEQVIQTIGSIEAQQRQNIRPKIGRQTTQSLGLAKPHIHPTTPEITT